MIDARQVPLVPFTEPATIRLISTAYIDEPAMQPLADSETELEILEKIEGLTSARHGVIGSLPESVNPEELVTEHHGYGWSYVNAAFCYTRLTGNRFNGPERGAWYATWGEGAVETAQAEVAWHLTRELEAAGTYENITAYRELIAGFTTSFHDLRDFGGEQVFDPDPEVGYGASQRLAASLLHDHKSNGVLYPSVRHSGGRCLAAFRPFIVQDVRQGDTWQFTWTGEPQPHITKLN